MSHWNRPFFPEWCGDVILDDSVTFDTLVRIAGSWAGIAHTFKAIANRYGWTRVVLLSNDDLSTVCWYGAKPFEEIIGHDENFTFTWLRLAADPTGEQLDDILHHIRAHTRGCAGLYVYLMYASVTCFLFMHNSSTYCGTPVT